ncbi:MULTISPECIES: hypothetical protein [Niastella]|uniref:Uncharacterized protein n=1 Tax=Niastella soli TaxID=2821487 RepID=A0ABS3YZK6_9BACT|nr:hypothetical protein [Niastella soli]MBO9203356.1 hypothetical protein [Niastella soli]
MKLILQILLSFYSLVSFGQTQETTTIKLSTGDCRRSEAYSWRVADTIKFYKLPEDTLVYKIIPRQYRQRPIKIENAYPGNYKLTYKNLYDQEVIEQIILTNQSTNSIVICPDKLLAYPQNTLAKLQDKDLISINFHTQGCFHSGFQKLIIIKESDKFVARLYSLSWEYVKKRGKTVMKYGDSTLLKATIMTSQNIQDLIRFENELNYAKDDGCTTTDWYDFKSKYLNIKKTDGTCSWLGFYYLKKSLFKEID